METGGERPMPNMGPFPLGLRREMSSPAHELELLASASEA